MSNPPILSLADAAFGYGERALVEHVSFEQHAGEVLALLGPNGSGKSTLVKGILGLAEHLSGTVELFGTPLEHVTDRARIGYVPQRHSLSDAVRATVREVVDVGTLARRPWWRPQTRADREAVATALEAVGMAERSDDPVASLSGGQQRRVLIARALASRPDILVMDEPTAGVDIGNQRLLADLLTRLAHDGASMLVVTHELYALRGAVSRILCLDGGHLDFDGSPHAWATHHEGGHELGSGHHHDHDARHPAATPIVGGAPLDAHGGQR